MSTKSLNQESVVEESPVSASETYAARLQSWIDNVEENPDHNPGAPHRFSSILEKAEGLKGKRRERLLKATVNVMVGLDAARGLYLSGERRPGVIDRLVFDDTDADIMLDVYRRVFRELDYELAEAAALTARNDNGMRVYEYSLVSPHFVDFGAGGRLAIVELWQREHDLTFFAEMQPHPEELDT